jgi:hypothetical protein
VGQKRQFVLSIIVLVAGAALDVGSRANAAYVSISESSSVSATDDSNGGRSPICVRAFRADAIPGQTGSMNGAGAVSFNHGSTAFAALCPIDLSAPSLVLFFAHREVPIHLSAFVESLLDPPRFA